MLCTKYNVNYVKRQKNKNIRALTIPETSLIRGVPIYDNQLHSKYKNKRDIMFRNIFHNVALYKTMALSKVAFGINSKHYSDTAYYRLY